MLFNCFNCGVSISTRLETCPHCKINNQNAVEIMKSSNQSRQSSQLWLEKTKGTILSLVTR